jgi:hypothetical protein
LIWLGAIALGALAVLSSWSWLVYEGALWPGTSVLSEDEADACEAVVRYQFDHNGSAQQRHARAFFVLILGKNPPPAFLARFVGETPQVVKGSKFRDGAGVLFRISSMRPQGPSALEVSSGYYEGSSSSSMETFRLIRRNDRWVVVGHQAVTISQAPRGAGVSETARAFGDARREAKRTGSATACWFEISR